MAIADTSNQPNIVVVYPHGSGGQWLSRVLSRMLNGEPWEYHHKNFHTKTLSPLIGKSHMPVDRSVNLIIDSPKAKYNFWLNYVRKRVCYSLSYRYVDGRRIYQNPYQQVTPAEDFFWLMTQCGFIQKSSFQSCWQLDWCDLVSDPDRFYQGILDCLAHAGLVCRTERDMFDQARDNYLQTVTLVPKHNHNHWFHMIWSLALLQNHGTVPDFPVFTNIKSNKIKSWLAQHHDWIQNQTSLMSYHV